MMADEDAYNDIDELDDDEGQGQLYEHFRVVVDKGQVPVRIDKFLFDRLVHSSRNRIQKAAEAGFIHVNDSPVKSNYRVRPCDIITLMLDRPHYDSKIDAEDIPLNIIYEDDSLLVVNKPAGLVVHPGCGNFNGTLVNAIAWHLRDVPGYDPNDPAVGLVHRIDKDTSGLLVIAKTPEAKSSLGVQFFNKTTHRSYNALVWGNFNEEEGRIEGNIARNPKDRLQMTVFPPDSDIGKHAVTHYRIVERFGYVNGDIILCRPTLFRNSAAGELNATAGANEKTNYESAYWIYKLKDANSSTADSDLYGTYYQFEISYETSGTAINTYINSNTTPGDCDFTIVNTSFGDFAIRDEHCFDYQTILSGTP